MTQEERQLLLKDLCARLPYNPHIWVSEHLTNIELTPYSEVYQYVMCEDCKPYLRPMSSMTEEEKKELSARYNFTVHNERIQIRYHSDGYWDNDTGCPTEEYLWLFDWLNKHHFDYRGLIEKGLALEAPEGMYKIE